MEEVMSSAVLATELPHCACTQNEDVTSYRKVEIRLTEGLMSVRIPNNELSAA
jgi:hypothetical protein